MWPFQSLPSSDCEELVSSLRPGQERPLPWAPRLREPSSSYICPQGQGGCEAKGRAHILPFQTCSGCPASQDFLPKQSGSTFRVYVGSSPGSTPSTASCTTSEYTSRPKGSLLCGVGGWSLDRCSHTCMTVWWLRCPKQEAHCNVGWSQMEGEVGG